MRTGRKSWQRKVNAGYTATLGSASEIQSMTNNMPQHNLKFRKWTVWCQEHANSEGNSVTLHTTFIKLPTLSVLPSAGYRLMSDLDSMLAYWGCYICSRKMRMKIDDREQKSTIPHCHFANYKCHINAFG